jgi:hypothetical protein
MPLNEQVRLKPLSAVSPLRLIDHGNQKMALVMASLGPHLIILLKIHKRSTIHGEKVQLVSLPHISMKTTGALKSDRVLKYN